MLTRGLAALVAVAATAPSALAEAAPREDRAELEELEALTATLSQRLLGDDGVGRDGDRLPPLRDRLPAFLSTHPVVTPHPDGENDEPPLVPLAPEVVDPARYDLPIRYNRQVAAFVEFFTGRGRGLFARWLARAGLYEDLIRATLKEHGLPGDLIYLAMIESGFNPFAVSRSGAVGIWQFVPSAGGDYGLDVTRWIDDRRHPVRATHAACQMLGDLHRRFRSWELAMAAYNTGVGWLTQAVDRYNTNDFWTIARHGFLPSKTRLYVAKVMAAAIVGKNREHFGFEAVRSTPPPATQPVRVPGGTRLATVGRAAGVDTDELEALNPAIVRRRVPPDVETYELQVPASSLARFTQRFDRLRSDVRRYHRHTLRYGERLVDVAKAYRVSLRSLRVLNDAAVRGPDAPRPGDELVVPVPKGRRPRAVPAPEPPEMVVMPTVRYDYEARRLVFFRVQKGYSLAGIARHFGVPAPDVVMWNRLAPHARLQPGMVLRLYVDEARDLSDTLLVNPRHLDIVVADSEEFDRAVDAARKAREARRRPKKRIGFRMHTVRSGESLGRIARRYRTTATEIAKLNKIDPNRLRVGQVLKIRNPRR